MAAFNQVLSRESKEGRDQADSDLRTRFAGQKASSEDNES